MRTQQTFAVAANGSPVPLRAGIPTRGIPMGAVSKETEPPRDPASPGHKVRYPTQRLQPGEGSRG